MKFGENLKKLRKLKKLSQEDLAEKMHVSRQSVSKWETCEAYPEMNNILELCKIFHCHINDLVNDSIIDIESLGEETKEKVVKLKKEQQAKMKILSKTIAIIAKICRIIVLICITLTFITMITLGIIASKVDIVDNQIIWNNKDTISITEIEDKVSIKINNHPINNVNNKELIKIKELFDNNPKIIIISYLEIGLIILLIELILVSKMLKSLELLFNNINKGDTPFTLENVNHIKKIAYLMIAVMILPYIIGIIFEMVLKTDLNIDFEAFNIIEILFLFSIAYIFKYGYEIQLDSNGKMYGNNHE